VVFAVPEEIRRVDRRQPGQGEGSEQEPEVAQDDIPEDIGVTTPGPR
jgi:hypothetical protein